MDHGPNIQPSLRRVRVPVIGLCAVIIALLVPSIAAAAAPTLADPADGHHYDYLDVAPTVRFDPVKDQVVNWVLLASDREMTKTVRFCRQFFWAAAAAPGTYGCNKWATGVDGYGNDTLVPLDAGQVYYWQVVAGITKDGEAGVKSEVRSFYVDAKPAEQSIEDISNQINGTVFDDGTNLNLGVAAYVNSGVRVQSLGSTRVGNSLYSFRIRGVHLGSEVDYTRSYVKVTSRAGTRYLKVAKVGASGVGTVWTLTANERKLKTKRFTYQLFLKSTKNGALVKSAPKVVLIKVKAKAPAWKPD